jgi:nucleoside-diphosphate-sugar epimerase
MRVGVIGLGHIGFPIAQHLNAVGHEIFSWTRSPRELPWENSLDLAKTAEENLEILFIASGATRPDFGTEVDELASTFEPISQFKFPKFTKVIYISSGAVYGECLNPRKEEDIAYPTTTYGKSKLNAEQNFLSHFGNQAVSLRVGNVIDQNNPYGFFNLLSKAVRDGGLEILGDPSDCRDYIGVYDFVSFLTSIIELQEIPQLLNIGSGKSLMLSQLVTLLRSEIDGDFTIDWKPRRTGDLSKTKLDTNKITNLIGIRATDPLTLIRDFVRGLN